jgi:hypothetical protein
MFNDGKLEKKPSSEVWNAALQPIARCVLALCGFVIPMSLVISY